MQGVYYPLTHAQKRIWYTEEFYPGTSISNLGGFAKLKSEEGIDSLLLQDAIRHFIRLNDSMRLRLAPNDGGEPRQYVSDYEEFEIAWLDCSTTGDVQAAMEWGQSEVSKPMELYDNNLFHFAVFKISSRESWLFATVHHVICDGISVVLLANQIIDLYLALQNGSGLPEIKPASYLEHIQSELEYEQSERFRKDNAYWTAQFVSVPEIASLKRSESYRLNTGAQRLTKVISEPLQKQIQLFCKEYSLSPLSCFLALLNIYMYRATGQDDVVVGTFMANRTNVKEKQMLGMFVSTIPVRTHVDENLDFLSFVRQCMKDQLTVIRHQKYPYNVLLNDLRKQQGNINKLFGVSLEFQIMQWQQKETISYLIEPMFSRNEINEISFHVKERWDTGVLAMDLDYRTELFSADEVEALFDCMMSLLEDGLAHPDKKIYDLEICSNQEKHRLREQYCSPQSSYAGNETLHGLFMQEAAKTPEQTAIVYGEQRFTNKELNEQSNRLGHALRAKGVGPDTPVAILLGRSAYIPAAIMGILKAGGAYVPIDPDVPEERVRFILKDSGAHLLITEAQLLEHYNLRAVESIVLDEAALGEGDSGNLPELAGSHNLAYIIYTSGTTGKPKGVMIEHRQVRHLIEALRNQVYASCGTTLNVALVAPFHFDASVQQIFASLLLGHTLYIVPKSSVVDGRALAEFYRSQRIDVTDGTPAHVQLLLAAGNLDGLRVRHMLIGGEALAHDTVRQLMEKFAQSGMVPGITNVYGPTECCVDASAFEITSAQLHERHGEAYVPIGRPLGNNRLYILDKLGRMQPPGIPGELFIAGNGVGRGYLNLPELTAEKFVADPFFPGEIMYGTGDWARWLPDGNAQFLGRMDDQVKIRGYRIELGEIEAVLLKNTRVRKAVVLARQDERMELTLCAYVVLKNSDEPLHTAELRDHLSERLPQYMLPSYFVLLDEIPLTSSGKVDRKDLLRLEVTAESGTDYAAPADELEARLASVWQDVLGMERIGIHDHFFELGGHSLKAMALLTRVHKECGVEVPLQLLFETPTIRAMAQFIKSADHEAFVSIEPAPQSESYPLSFAQQRVYIVSQFETAGTGYNMPAAVMLEGRVDVRLLERAFRELIQRHESLRTAFVTIDGTPVQQVRDHIDFEINVREPGEQTVESAMTSFVVPFDLSHAPLLRVGLVPLEEDKHMMLVDMHHLISDGVSIGIILNDLARLYAGEGEQLPELRLQYKDYSVWQSGQAAFALDKDEQYWLAELSGELPMLQLLTDHPRPPVQSFKGDRASIKLDTALTDKLKKLAERNGATLYMVLLAGYSALLARYTGQDDILIGAPTAGRNHAELEGVVGMFVNTLPIRTRINGQGTFSELLAEVRRNVLNAFQHQNYPFERLVEKLAIFRDLSRNPLFDTMFVLQNAFEHIPEIGGVRLSIHETNFHIAKFDLTLQANEEPDGITLDMDYSTELFRRDTVERMLGLYMNLLQSITADSGLMLGEYSLLAEEEKQQLMSGFNPPRTPYPKQRTTAQLFEEQVEKMPDSPALAFEGATLSYGQLNARANQLARTLRSKGVQRGAVVAMLMNRSVEMIVGVMAILKSGGAYVPIDPEHPVQRISYFIADSGASVLLTQRCLQTAADEIEFAGDCVFADDEGLYRGDTLNLGVEIEPGHLANLTYTSGTSGNPKGNMVTHANIIRTVKNTNYLEITSHDVLISLSNYVFDAFMFDFFGALLNGAKLVLASKDTVLDISRLPQVIKQERITVMMITTALFNLLVDVHPSCMSGIRKVLFGGERASVEHVRKALEATGKGKLLHMYGPSESTVFATYYPVDEVAENVSAIPIGRPVSNTTVHILDAFRQPQPVGVPGELCVAGDGLVLGYASRPELTDEKFVAHPFDSSSRMYRTGDLARWLPDGNIEFIGRIDHQVKIRGQRIELGEIEHQLLRHESIREAIVIALDTASGETQLCAYVVTNRTLSNGELRAHVGNELPAYMIPFVFIRMDELPLTGNGKVDRRALPKPDPVAASEAEYAAPRNATEVELANVWQEVLGIERVGVHDNFFELGGHSLKAMTMLARLHRTMRVEVPLRWLFQSPTVAALAEMMSAAAAEDNPYQAIASAGPGDVYPLSSSQKRLYVLQQLEGAEQSYNMPCVMCIEGPLHKERFEAAMRQLIHRHEALRTSFDTVKGEPVQRIHQEVDFAVGYKEAAEEEAGRIIGEFIRPFALQEAPLVRAVLVRLTEERHLLLFDMHHIISDGTSVSVLFDEITKLYAGEQLEPLRIQYKDYAVWQQSFLQTDAYRKQQAYWLEQFAGELPVLNLPTDYTRPATQRFAGNRIDFVLDSGLSQALSKLAHQTGTTLFMVLLASFSAFLAKLSGQDDIVVGIPVAGRPHADLERVVGMFVNTLPMRTQPYPDKTFAQYLLDVKQRALEAYEYQNYPFEELVGKVQVERDMSRNPLFDAMFVMQNMDMQDLQLEGAHMEPYPFGFNVAKFDLSLSVTEQNETLACSMEYNTALFKRETIERWSGYFSEMLRHISKQPAIPLAGANLLNDTEMSRLLAAFNDTIRVYPREKTIHGLFEDQVGRLPDHAAVVIGDEVITYRELNAKANRLARTLRANGLLPDNITGIMVEPSVDLIIGIMAILKAGGAYLPIDPDYPEERLRYLIVDSGAALVLTHRKFTGRVHGVELLYMDDPASAPETIESTNLTHVNSSRDLAYVIYTSGSTGQPKGVMVEHRNVVRLVKNAGYIPLDDTCRVAQTGAVSFDASTFEIFGALLNGGTLYPVSKSTLLDVAGFTDFLQDNRITTMWLTAPLFNQLAQENAAMFSAVGHLIVGGDALTPRYVNLVRHACPTLALWNGYGPTENTTFSTSFLIDKDFVEHIPIGKPIGNSTAYIVNAINQPQPIGIPGELCVSGDGVARGYLNRDDLTKEKFVDNPFEPGERMYRTGDLARWLSDGSIEFLGRIDNQVKIRGFRIELGEIESQLAQVEGVNEAVVIVQQNESGQNRLCAYIIGELELSIVELRAALSHTLPGYMIPSYFVQMDKMPLTMNGKVDRKALPEPDVRTGTEEYEKPRNEREQLLADIWQELLGTGRVGINDNFFSLGGDSIKAIQMGARLNKHGWKLEMKQLFQNPTIAQVSGYMEWMKGEKADQGAVVGEVTLTPIQRWFFGRRFTDMHHWNQSVMLYAPAGFKKELLERTLRKLFEHHDTLRMVYTAEHERLVQYNLAPDEAVPELEVIRLNVTPDGLESAIVSEAERIQSSIDLSRGPLLKAALFQTAQGDHLLIVIHHLVVDGVSWRILMEDFAAAYIQAEMGAAIVLPDKTHSYREWAAKLQEYADSKAFLKEIDYWSQLDYVSVVSLPKDHETGDRRMSHARMVHFSLSATETELLTTRVHLAYRTEMNDILLTALGLAVKDWTGHQRVLVNLEGHGREEIMRDINVSRTVGWFTTQYPVLLDMNYSADPAYQIKRVKEDLRHIPNKGIGFGLLRYVTGNDNKAGFALTCEPEISFNYLGQFAETAGAGLFKRSLLSTGNSLSLETEKMHPIDVVGVIEGDALSINISYNAMEYEETTMIRLRDSFKAHLLLLIEQCLNRDGSELTPSDLGDDNLTLEELDKLLEIL